MTNSVALLRDLYVRMLLTRIVDQYACKLAQEGQIDFVASCRGHEAAQVGSAICIEIGTDFTLPYYRDLGVVLTVGMTPYEVFRTYLQVQQFQAEQQADSLRERIVKQPILHWGYQKHNTVTVAAPVATQILHAAGIAFASKLRKAAVVTVAYCGDGAITEPDFLEGIRFAALHQLPVVFICEQDCSLCANVGNGEAVTTRQSDREAFSSPSREAVWALSAGATLQDYRDEDQPEQGEVVSCTQNITLPEGLTHHCVDGTDILAVTNAMRAAMQHAREGHGPVLLEMHITRPLHSLDEQDGRGHSESVVQSLSDLPSSKDPLVRCQQLLHEQGAWDEAWSLQLHTRLTAEVEQALQDAMRDTR